ncbi:MAG TPA: hypothetical protein VNU44_14495 [Bryobacteraceae bacterium]|jgi:hypothetical protein|nr:hypothetical protein [Bryobacteraceae bacterium]
MPGPGLPKPFTRSAAQKLPHPCDVQFNAVQQASYTLAAGKVAGGVGFTVPAAAVHPTPCDSQFDLIVQIAYNAKYGTDGVPQ